MGAHDVRDDSGHPELRAFTRALLDDLRALDRMIEEGKIESGLRRMGAEQEMFLVDSSMRPAMTALEILDDVRDRRLTTELGRFNLEANLTPRRVEADCFAAMEAEIEEILALVREAAERRGVRILLTGILPTARQRDLGLEAMTPNPRYLELNRVLLQHRGGVFRAYIKGLDELQISHDNILIEACLASFQVHLQVGPEEFVDLYNTAQLVTAPVLAAAANSPVFLQHRLWRESRIALLQQSVDSRSDLHRARRAQPRVRFGRRWLDRSVLEIFREDVARFRVFMATELGEPSTTVVERGETPALRALCLHNSTVYRWNRPCYGVRDGRAHLRIEHRALPSGPTVRDEVANAAFFVGLVSAARVEYGDVRSRLAFDDVRANFYAAARYALQARVRWIGGRSWAMDDLILEELLPLAAQGLSALEVRADDVRRYLGTIEERVRSGRNGASWILDSLAGMGERRRNEERYAALAASMHCRSSEGRPVHEWPLAELDESVDWLHTCRVVEQVMTTDLFTLHPDDLVDLAKDLMDWEQIRHIPVEDSEGRLVGLVTHQRLLRLFELSLKTGGTPIAVREVMDPNPATVSPGTPCLDAVELLRRDRLGALPVIDAQRRLLGIVSERDFIPMTARLLAEKLRER